MSKNEKGNGDADKTIPFPGGNTDSDEKQGGKGDNGDNMKDAAKQPQPPEIKMETCVMVAIDTNGNVGISTNPGVQMNRELKMSDVPGFLISGAMNALTMSINDDMEGIVRQTLAKMAMTQPAPPPAPAPAPEASDDPEPSAEDGDADPEPEEVAPAPEKHPLDADPEPEETPAKTNGDVDGDFE